MKARIITSLIVLLVLAVLVGNWIYGKKVATELDKQLQDNIENNELPLLISYSGVTVNPLFSKVVLKDFNVSDLDSNVSFNSEAVQLHISIKEARRLSKEPEINDIKSFEVQFKKSVLPFPENMGEIALDNLTIDFDGHLTKADFENLSETFPSEKQSLKVSLSNLDVANLNFGSQPSAITELQKQLSSIDEGKVKVILDPKSKEILLNELSLSSPKLKSSSNIAIHYSGEGADDFKPLTAIVKTDHKTEPIDIHFDQGGNTVDFSLTSLAIASDFMIDFEKPSALPVGKISFLTEGLMANSPAGSGSIISLPIPGASVDELDIERFSINYELKDDNLKISDTELISTLIGAELNADVSLDLVNQQNSTINNALLVIHKLSPELEGVVAMIEGQSGKKLPRVDDKITLEITGTLGSPKIKGFE